MAGYTPFLRSIFRSRPTPDAPYWCFRGPMVSHRPTSPVSAWGIWTLRHPQFIPSLPPLWGWICLRAPVRNFHIPSPPLHLGVLIKSQRLLVFNYPPLWHVNFAQVIAGQRFLPLLDHRHLWPEVGVHEVNCVPDPWGNLFAATFHHKIFLRLLR